MKLLIPLAALTLVTLTATAQKFELQINANGNFTWLPDFKNRIYIVDGFIVPNLIDINNARNPPVITETRSETRPGGGYTIEAEVAKRINERWKLSFAVGVMEMSFSYRTYIAQSFYRNDFYLGNSNTNLTYLIIRPVNVAFNSKRFIIQGGPVVSYLLGKKYTNRVVIYDINTHPWEALGAFFEEKGDAQKMLYGAHAYAGINVARNIDLLVGSQYFFNSIYKKEGTYKPLYDKGKAFQAQLGISYHLARF
ncbi:hypothetical protein A3860_22240 [Niastella vici]|uniref:Outer membrane protein beta-barrel domain-containing protein n=1 Tax=Niastella vici TaxID=1703345 RepID=A0A1V9G0S1_9BACT|nr:hypothetical protein [Niastella vici]OQP64128.1 hypothetical protein A3860_22240 [Niastella vici]